jgi:hypothetical protein
MLPRLLMLPHWLTMGRVYCRENSHTREVKMTDAWEILVTSAFDDEFGDARSEIAHRSEQESPSHADPIRKHISVADRAFELVALTLEDASTGQPSTSKQVIRNLLTQIAQDSKAIRLLVTHGFPYQAVTVSVSSFEHSMMIGSIGSDDARAQDWLDHPNLSQNLDSVKKLIQLTLDNLEQSFPGIKANLGDPYDKVYKPLCAIKHGNPIAQQHMNHEGPLPSSFFAPADRRSTVAAMWALEASVRACWIGLISFIPHHGIKREDTDEMVRGLNSALNELMQLRKAVEDSPN